MVLMTGAVYAGKHELAQALYGISAFCDGETADFSEILTAEAVSSYHRLVYRLLQNGKSPQIFTQELIQQSPDMLILMNEVGSGIVPIEPEERRWREECGICARMIAKEADTVIRVVCGIPSVLKGELP